MKEKTIITIPFRYEVYDAGRLECSDVFNMGFTESALKNYAKILQEKGGHPVDLVDLGNITDKVYDELFPAIADRFPEKESFDEMEAVLQEDMPEELVSALDSFILEKSADIHYVGVKDGREVEESASVNVPKEAFARMVDAVTSPARKGEQDFEFLRASSPAAYETIYNLVAAKAACSCIALKEFPLEVYDYI